MSIQSYVIDLKGDAVESLQHGQPQKVVKAIFSMEVKDILKHNCDDCSRSQYDVEHDISEFGTPEAINELWSEVLSEYQAYLDGYDCDD